MDRINIHIHSGQHFPPMPPLTIWDYTRTSELYYSERSRNWTIEWSPKEIILGCYRNPITEQTTTWGGVISTSTRTTSPGRQTFSWHQIKWGFNVWINVWNNHHYHWWNKLGVARQKRSLVGHPHHIHTTTVLRTAETGWPPFTPQALRENFDLPNAIHVWDIKSKPSI